MGLTVLEMEKFVTQTHMTTVLTVMPIMLNASQVVPLIPTAQPSSQCARRPHLWMFLSTGLCRERGYL